MSAIEKRHRKQVEQSNRHRQYRSQVNQCRKADGGDLAGDLGDPNRPADLIGVLSAGEDSANIGDGAIDDEPGFLHAQPNSGCRIHRLGDGIARPGRPGDSEHADPMDVAEAVLDLTQLRRSIQLDHRFAPLHREDHRRSRPGAHDSLHVGKALDRAAVDGGHDVAGLEPGGRCGAVLLHGIDTRSLARFAEEREESREDDNRKQEVRNRTGRDDGGACTNALAVEGNLAFLFRHCPKRIGRWRTGL